MFELRPYQKEAVEAATSFFRGKDKTRPILVLPTGAGKSLVIAFTVRDLPGNVLILQPSKELLEQNYGKYMTVIKDHGLEPASIYSASAGIKERGRVTFATIGSIYKNPEIFADTDHVMVDECHFVPPQKGSMYTKLFSALPNAKVIGLTATPYRLKTYADPINPRTKFSKINLLPRERPQFFNRFLYIVQTAKMYEEGFLAPVNYVSTVWDGTNLKANSTGAEYTESSMDEVMSRNDILKRIPGLLEQAFRKGRRACLVFVRTVEEARHLASITPFSDYIHAETPKDERARIIEAFKGGGIKTIFNVSVLTTGFDFPGLDTIFVCRPTMSLALFVQMVGRGVRLSADKDHCTIVDMCGNLKRFGKLEDLRIEDDPQAGWVLRNDKQIISGRRLDELEGV